MKRKRSKLSVGAHSMPADMLTEIFLHLPTKSLRRFQSVSKLWKDLISQALSERKRLLPITGLLIRPSDHVEFYVSIALEAPDMARQFISRLRNLNFYPYFRVIHSCNGLLLFSRIMDHAICGLYIVWNPISKESVELPTLPARENSHMDCFLAYDPGESPHYKVVQFNFDSEPTEVIVKIYSSLTGEWGELNVPREYPFSLRGSYDMAAFHKGDLYLLTRKPLQNVIRFDITMERFYSIKLPDYRSGASTDTNECIGESRGNFYYAVNYSKQFELKIFMLKTHPDPSTNPWSLVYIINTKNDIPSGDLSPIAFHPESEVIYLSIQNKIFLHNSCDHKFEEVPVVDYNYSVSWRRVFFVIPCLESINPPGGKFISEFSME